MYNLIYIYIYIYVRKSCKAKCHTKLIFSVLYQKPCIKTRKVINRGKRSTTLNEEELVENIRICRVFQRQVSHKKRPFLYVSCKTTNHFGLEKDNPSQRNC